ncbi:hypothetical protein [Caloranaerobacter sp. DY30410]|uniref:hypothetical protein n=1 Tax=Caloranaerobacter sp. DY30410 TaxID=3238305 RepID=UPI003CFBE7C1
MKKMMLILTIFILVLACTVGVYADSTNNEQVIDLKKSDFNGYLKVEDEQTVVSKVLTFEELVERIAKDNNISKLEATNEIIRNYAKNKIGINSLSTNNLKALMSNKTYRVISSRFTVTSVYKPSLVFYCETSEGGSFWGIVKILYVGMNREYNGIVKQFNGTVYSNLENAGRIFWIVNGDFYDKGTTTFSGGVDIGIGESATVKFNLSYSSNYYAYCYEEGSYNIR